MRAKHGFTLVEILIVVVILGILAAVIVPQFAQSAQQAAQAQTITQLQNIRAMVELYANQSNGDYPNVVAGPGDPGWAELLSPGFLRQAPRNMWVAGANSGVIVLGNTADAAYQQAHGWIFDPSTGEVLAGSFTASDLYLPKP